MGTTYKATITIRCWKEHTCLGCGKIYRYRFERTKSGEGDSESAAEKAVEAAVIQAMANEVDMRPCPGCGLHQPDMIGNQRRTRHWWVTGITLLVLAILLLLAGTKLAGAGPVSLIMAVVAAVSLLGHYVIYSSNPNRDLGANQKAAEAAVAQGKMEIGPPAGTAAEPPPLTSPSAKILFALMAAAALAMASAEAWRTVNGWPANPGWFPGVAGPGDTILMYFPQQFSSIKSYWRGTATVEILNASEVGYNGPGFRGTTQTDGWAQSISAKSSEKNSSVTPWAYVDIAAAPELAGKQLRLRVNLSVKYPAMDGRNTFSEMEGNLTHVQELRLGSPHAGATYNRMWWFTTVVGSLLLVGMGYGMTWVAGDLCNKAGPTNVVPCE